MRKLAQRLLEPVDQMWSLTDRFASELHKIDDGFRVLIERAGAEALQDPTAKTAICVLFNTVRSMTAHAHSALARVQQMTTSMAPVEKMSRDVRPVLRRLREALTRMIEAGAVMDEWVTLIDATGVDCAGALAESGPTSQKMPLTTVGANGGDPVVVMMMRTTSTGPRLWSCRIL
jgi:hypothetical protein